MGVHRIDLATLAENNNGHSLFSPSSSKMWLTCSGSLIPNAQAEDSTSEAAAEGTVAHGVGELWLKTGCRPTHLIGTVERVVEDFDVYNITIDEVMLDYVQRYVDWCMYLPGENFIETRVDFSDLTPIANQGGTADHISVEMHHLTITDLKYGIGIEVYAERNTQLMLYAYGALLIHDAKYDIQKVTIRIAQPRRDHFDEWTVSREELLEFAEYVKQRAFDAWRHDAPRMPSGDGCQWCRVKSDCSAFLVFTGKLLDGVFDDLESPVTAGEMLDTQEQIASGSFNLTPVTVENLTFEQKAVVYQYRSLIVQWFDRIGADMYNELRNGGKVPGYKLVDGNNSRKFTSDAAAIELLEFIGLNEDEYMPRVLLSPAQSEAALVKKGIKRAALPALLESVINKTPGKPTMVSENDRRESVTELADLSFDNLETNNI
jgi:hypothetical protein